MAYTPTEWECGDTVTAEKLNAMERGIADMNDEYVPNVWACGDTITAEKMNHMEQGIAQGGGGGSSDFSTAEVTIVNNTSNAAKFECPAILPNDNLSITTLLLGNGATATLNAILYKGACYNEIVIIDTVTEELIEPSSISGGVTYDDEEMTYTVTGDCTITLSGAE